ncbi:efflux RND transporter periplasmic adaptor subunit [Duganella aceris]|uniref:HlyD family efflux transporter periplasmic adaptor subunit n=1 Tax=Duganella aceris TaxID=2703883 RepID=A0ABX0FUY1_9BURK|nr:HlyD family efflux transporter periplasmic adaptor subunit [Duganella aceris]NGZ88259.1 HlyD family efflux transporter periplasmic adaptor subunit [Duganella aceris]
MDQALNPDIIARRKRKTALAIAALLATLCAAAWGINRAVSPSVDAAGVMLAEVRVGNIANTINASGIVIPVHEEFVSSPIQTRVAKVNAKLGQQVQANELLLELDNRTILLAIDAIKEQLAQQENRILALTLEMEQKRKQLISAIELLELDLEATRVKLGRYQTLRKAGGVSAEDLLTAELNVKRNEIQLRQQHEQIADSKRVTSSNIEGARLQKNILQKQLLQQQELLAQTQVRAPFAGMLTWLLADEGASVATGQLVAKVSELNNYKVEASLSDFHARALGAGQKVLVEQGNVKLDGVVQTVLPEIQNGTVKLLVTLAQPNHAMLRNKLRVEVNIVTEQKKNTLLADYGPAFNGRGPQDVFVVRDGVARKTTLDIGASDGKSVEILSGARAGDRLIISDTSRYKERDSVRVAQ